MGIWNFFHGAKRRRDRRQAGVGARQESSPERYRTPVVGVHAYQRHLVRICGGRKEESAELPTTARLIPESSNPHDANAVRVEIDGQTIGYLSRHDAFLYRVRMAAGTLSSEPIECGALVKGGWDRGEEDVGLFGVRLDFDLRPPPDQSPCPACRKSIEPTPVRNMNCPHCGRRIVVRNGQPLTETDAAAYAAIPVR